MDNVISNPHWLVVDKKYSIKFPCYDDYNEGLESELVNVLILNKIKNGYIVKYIDCEYETELSYSILSSCEIKELF